MQTGKPVVGSENAAPAAVAGTEGPVHRDEGTRSVSEGHLCCTGLADTHSEVQHTAVVVEYPDTG